MRTFAKIAIITIIVIFAIIISIILSIDHQINVGEFYYLEPKSSNGTQLVANTKGFLVGTNTYIYVKYPDSDELHYTGVYFSKEVPREFVGSKDSYSIEWVDDHVVIFDINAPIVQNRDFIENGRAEIRY